MESPIPGETVRVQMESVSEFIIKSQTEGALLWLLSQTFIFRKGQSKGGLALAGWD
jgi:hypothetical protein